MLKRAGHTEATVDLARMAGCYPAGLLCEIVTEDKQQNGAPARAGALRGGAQPAHDLDRGSRPLPAPPGKARRAGRRRPHPDWSSASSPPTGSRSLLDGQEHLAFVAGELSSKDSVLVRVHSECLTGDVFGSLRCDCGPQLEAAVRRIGEEGVGVIVYLRGHEGRGIGLTHKLRAYNLQDSGRDTVDANVDLGLPVDSREYGIGAQILVELGVTKMRLMTNNPAKYGGLEGYGLDIVGRVPLELAPNPENVDYLRTKRERMGHLLGSFDLGGEGAAVPDPQQAPEAPRTPEALTEGTDLHGAG